MFGLIPRETAFFEMFQKAAHNMIEGSRLLQEMMENFQDPETRRGRSKMWNILGTALRTRLQKS